MKTLFKTYKNLIFVEKSLLFIYNFNDLKEAFCMSRWKNVENFIDDTMPNVDLFIKFKTTKLDKKHQFVEHTSGVYNCKEFIWTGFLRNGLKFSFVKLDKKKIPYEVYDAFKGGPGFTFDDETTCTQLLVKNALCFKDEHNENIIYNYTNEESYLEYKGKFRKVTIFIRLYDNLENNENNRWVALNLK